MNKSFGLTTAVLLATGLMVAKPQASQAQINFSFITTFAGTTAPTVYPGGFSGAFTVNPNQEAVLRDASGLGAVIHLVNNLGTSEFATDPSNNSSVVATDNFVVTINQQNGGSASFTVPFSINALFNAGGNSAGQTSSTFTNTAFSIGGNSYLVNAFQSTDPAAPPVAGGSSPTPGDVTVHIQAMGPTTVVPEPGSVALAFGMLGGAAFTLRRRARK